jgi:ParB family chromosome partitioning protein
MIAVNEIVASPYQPRRIFDDGALAQLADSIRRAGVMQPIIVRRATQGAGSGGGVRYELVAGERRWRAARLAGIAAIPALVRDLSDEQAAEWAVIENVQREDLNPMERAEALQRLSSRFRLTQAQIAERVGIDRSSVANLIRLLELEEPLRLLVSSGSLGLGHGRALLGVAPGPARVTLGERAASEGWSVRKLERVCASIAAPVSATTAQPGAADFSRLAARAALEKQLGEHLGTKVQITTDRSGNRGRLTIEFFDLDHFDGLLTKLGFTPR